MSRPRLHSEGNLVPGLAAIALFVVFAVTFLTAAIPDPAGFGENGAIMRSLGAALFSIDAAAVVSDGTPIDSEGFLVSFLIIAVVLDVALDGSLMLARREEGGENVTVGTEAAGGPDVAADGGEE